MKTPSSLLLTLGLCCLLSWAAKPGVAAPDSTGKPNILLILTDDQGYGDVAAYGAEDLETPAMDSLVRDGIRFDNFYANSPVCSPTRAALLTGRYPEYVGVPGVIRTDPADSWGYLAPKAVMLPELLNQAGYHTALIGKWHLGLASPNTPLKRGFDHFHGFLGDMMDDYWTHLRHGQNYMYRNDTPIQPEGHATDLFTRWSVEYVRSRAREEGPWFLYLAYNAPHTPVQPPEEWLARVRNREPEISETRARLVAFIEHLDHGIGAVLEALRETGQDQNTLIVFTSDNGGHLPSEADNGPWRSGKQHLYEGGIRVPATAVWEGKIDPGRCSDLRLISMDLLPTLVEAAGLTVTHRIEGLNFLSHMLNAGWQPPQVFSERPLFFTRREGNRNYRGQTIDAVRLGDWKLLQDNPFAPQELYNLAEDPYETRDLFEQQREKAWELNRLLMRHRQNGGRVPWQSPDLYHPF